MEKIVRAKFIVKKEGSLSTSGTGASGGKVFDWEVWGFGEK
ncbi:MAG: hypothetical protein ABIR18_04675 [Chitinophagaceae bacterium]